MDNKLVTLSDIFSALQGVWLLNNVYITASNKGEIEIGVQDTDTENSYTFLWDLSKTFKRQEERTQRTIRHLLTF